MELRKKNKNPTLWMWGKNTLKPDSTRNGKRRSSEFLFALSCFFVFVFLGFSSFCSLSFRSAFPVFYRQFFLAFCCYVRRFCFLFFLFVVAFFCSKLGPKTDSKSIKIVRKSSQNRRQIRPKSSPEGGPARNLKNYRFFLSFFRLLGASWAVWAASWGLRRPKLEAKTEQKSIKNRSQNSCKFKGHLNLDFRRILVDFWSQNGAKLGSKSDQKRSLC